jgi:hypothetical protein
LNFVARRSPVALPRAILIDRGGERGAAIALEFGASDRLEFVVDAQAIYCCDTSVSAVPWMLLLPFPAIRLSSELPAVPEFDIP